MSDIVVGTWSDEGTGLRHIAAGTLLNISAPSRWSTRTSCGKTVYVCPDIRKDDTVTCIRCLGAAKPRGILRGKTADAYFVDEAQNFDLSDVGVFKILDGTP